MSFFNQLLLKDYVTLLGTVCATIAIFLAIMGLYYSDPQLILVATFSWGGAIMTDLFDGLIARKLNQTNEIGKEIDSLSDAVSFVVTPPVIILCAGLYGEFITYDIPWILLFGIIVFIFCGITRLAWFNVENTGEGYTGLVTPLSATILMLFYISHYHFTRLSTVWPEYHLALSPIANFFGNVISLSVLMIILGILNLAPILKYGLKMQKKRGIWKKYLIGLGIFLGIMIILAAIFTGLNQDIAIIVGHIFPLGFLFCVLGYVVHGFINYLNLRKKKAI